jgi:hypothetical protein
MEHADMFKVVEGILMGAIDLSIPSAETCISDVDTLTSEVEEAITDFKKMSFSGVKAGINMIGTIAGEVEGDIADCKVSAEDAKKLAEMADNFKTPWSFIFHMGKNILLNGVDIYNEIEMSLDYYDQGDYYNFGYQIGEALEEVLVGDKNPSSLHSTTLGWGHSDMYKFTEGLLKGAIDLSVPSASRCFKDIDDLTTDVEEAVTDFKKMSFSGVKAGIHKVGDVVDEIEADIADCKVSAEDAKKLTEMAKNFKSPWSFIFHMGKNILLDGVDIYNEIESALDYYDKGDYYNYGYQLGEALEHVLVGDKNSHFTQ